MIGSPSASKQAQRSHLPHDVGRWDDDGTMGRCGVFLAQEGSWQILAVSVSSQDAVDRAGLDAALLREFCTTGALILVSWPIAVNSKPWIISLGFVLRSLMAPNYLATEKTYDLTCRRTRHQNAPKCTKMHQIYPLKLRPEAFILPSPAPNPQVTVAATGFPGKNVKERVTSFYVFVEYSDMICVQTPKK